MTVTQRERAELGVPNADFTATGLMRLWTQRDDLMPMTPQPKTVPYRLAPGDVIATGTPGGVGRARTPARYLKDGATLVTRIKGIGECRNVCVRERA